MPGQNPALPLARRARAPGEATSTWTATARGSRENWWLLAHGAGPGLGRGRPPAKPSRAGSQMLKTADRYRLG